MDFLALMKMMGGSGGGGGGPMEMLSTLFNNGKGKQEAPAVPEAPPMPNLLPQTMPQGVDTERIRRAVANRPTLGMMR